MGQELEQEEEA